MLYDDPPLSAKAAIGYFIAIILFSTAAITIVVTLHGPANLPIAATAPAVIPPKPKPATLPAVEIISTHDTPAATVPASAPATPSQPNIFDIPKN